MKKLDFIKRGQNRTGYAQNKTIDSPQRVQNIHLFFALCGLIDWMLRILPNWTDISPLSRSNSFTATLCIVILTFIFALYRQRSLWVWSLLSFIFGGLTLLILVILDLNPFQLIQPPFSIQPDQHQNRFEKDFLIPHLQKCPSSLKIRAYTSDTITLKLPLSIFFYIDYIHLTLFLMISTQAASFFDIVRISFFDKLIIIFVLLLHLIYLIKRIKEGAFGQTLLVEMNADQLVIHPMTFGFVRSKAETIHWTEIHKISILNGWTSSNGTVHSWCLELQLKPSRVEKAKERHQRYSDIDPHLEAPFNPLDDVEDHLYDLSTPHSDELKSDLILSDSDDVVESTSMNQVEKGIESLTLAESKDLEEIQWIAEWLTFKTGLESPMLFHMPEFPKETKRRRRSRRFKKRR